MSALRKGTALGGAETESGAAPGNRDSEPEARTTEDRVYSVVCPRCGDIVVGELPAEARRAFGPRLTPFVAQLKVVYRLSLRQIQRLLEAWFGVRMSLGQVSARVTEAAEALAEPYEEIGQEVRSASTVHADETCWRVEKEGAWLWVAVTDNVTYYLIRRSRSQAVAKELLGRGDWRSCTRTGIRRTASWIPMVVSCISPTCSSSRRRCWKGEGGVHGSRRFC